MPFNQSCKWNERSLNRGLNRGRGLGIDETFFWNSCSNLEIDENFRISYNLGLGLAAKISQAFAIQLVRYRGQYTPRPTAHPPKNPYLVCFHALLGAHVVWILDIFPTFSEWRRVPFFRALYFRESLFLMHKCLNRDHHSCDKPLKAKVFFILYPSRAV